MPQKKKKIADPGPVIAQGKNGAIYLDKTVTVERGFKPQAVNWDDLLTLYQDDPLLAAVFSQMEEWCKSEEWDGTASYQWTLNSPGTVFSTTSNVGISNSFTLRYDSSGAATLTEDK